MAKGKRTARSQNYLRQYGYPSNRSLRREAKHVARSSVPTVRSIEKPYDRQIQSARDFLSAVQGALADTNAGVNSAYSDALSQQQGVTDAAQARLAGLGLGVDAAGVQAASGATGDSAASQLISNAASARNYSAKLPGIAAGAASVDQAGLRKQMLDALQNRRDQMRQAYFPALESARSAALQRAGFNQSQDQFLQNMSMQRAQMAQQASQFGQSFGLQQQQFAEGKREFGISQATAAGQQAFSNKLARSQFKAQYGYDPITGQSASGSASALGPLTQYSPAQLAEIAKASSSQLAPSHSVRTTQRDKNGKTIGSTSLVVHELPPAFQGQDFGMTINEMMKNGVPANVAYWQAQQLYQSMGNIHTAKSLADGILRANKQATHTLADFRSSKLWAQMQNAYYSYLKNDPSIYSGNPRG